MARIWHVTVRDPNRYEHREGWAWEDSDTERRRMMRRLAHEARVSLDYEGSLDDESALCAFLECCGEPELWEIAIWRE